MNRLQLLVALMSVASTSTACDRTRIALPDSVATAQPNLSVERSEAAPRSTSAPSPVANREQRIHVPGGSVIVGGKPIAVSEFSMDRTEVTVREYIKCVQAGRCTPSATAANCNASQPEKKADHPINCVTVEQARVYCESQRARLPSVAEWQLAAAGPEGRVYPWGDAAPSNIRFDEAPQDGAFKPGPARHHLCWVGDGTAQGETFARGTCPVGTHTAGNTPSGIADLAGNVWEWTSDSAKLPHGPLNHVLKGGSYEYDRMGLPEYHVTDAETHEPKHSAPNAGFRCVAG
ncbi:MAG: hypothetical protein RL701_1727 [Pseudomonadota bacterium]|jgi:formylglycine-generating enzyme required for sulfatase activity